MKTWLLQKDHAGYSNLMVIIACSVLCTLITLLVITL